MKLIVFPGNPGKQYEKTRHNIAWRVLDHIQEDKNLVWKKKFNALWVMFTVKDEKIVLLKPEVFMNNTGKSVQSASAFFKISADSVTVIHDDIELPFGYFVFKKDGGAGGHNGLRSIAQSLGSENFYRLRLGISRPGKEQVASYVLSRFSKAEEAELPDFVRKSADILEEWINSRPEEVPGLYFKKQHWKG